MHRPQLAAGIALLLVGLFAIAIAHYDLPHPSTPLTAVTVGTPHNTSLPPLDVVPSTSVVQLPNAPVGTFVVGNFTTYAPGGMSTTASLYLLNASDQLLYNATLANGGSYPSSFLFALGNQSGASWHLAADRGSPFALLYLSPNGDDVNLTESVSIALDPNGTSGTPIQVPPTIHLPAEAPRLGRTVVPIPTLGSLSLGVGGSFSLSSRTAGGVWLYLLSPNNTTVCPASSFIPTAPSCEGQFFPEEGWYANGTSVTPWFLHVRGTYKGWSMVFLSSLPRSTPLHLNATEWDLPPGTIIDSATAVAAVGAACGFFGFLAITGSFVRGAKGTEGREDSPEGGTTAARQGGLPKPDLDGWRREAVAPRVRSSLRAAPVRSRPASASGKQAPGPATSRSAASGRATCGVCGTGYPLRPSGPSCPVCGSKSVVFAPASGMELL